MPELTITAVGKKDSRAMISMLDQFFRRTMVLTHPVYQSEG